jgi:hypothetical protein
MDFIFIYMDDILVASRDETAHLQHLEKCKVGHQSVDFLGHRISAAFAETPLQNMAVIRDFTAGRINGPSVLPGSSQFF